MGDSGSLPRGPLSSAEALVVEPSVREAVFWSTELSASGFRVTVASNFQEARVRLGVRPPSLLLTEVRLGDYNGLHLVLRARAAQPSTCALLIADDTSLARDADELNVTFIVKPVRREEFLAAVFRSLFCVSDTRVRPPFERRVLTRRRQSSPHGEEERRVTPDRRQDPSSLIRAAHRFNPTYGSQQH